MYTYIKAQAMLALLLLSGSLLAAASSCASATIPEVSRTLMLLQEKESEGIMFLPIGLQTGVRFFLGLGKERDYKMADTCFRSVLGVKLLSEGYLCKARLFRAVMQGSGGYGIEARPEGAYSLAKGVIDNQGAFRQDKFYAFLIMTDCQRISEHQFKHYDELDTYASKLIELAKELGSEYDSLRTEFFQRVIKLL